MLTAMFKLFLIIMLVLNVSCSICSSEPRSTILKQAFFSNTDSRRAMEQTVMRSVSERDYAARETMYHLFYLKLHSSSFRVIQVNLNGSC